MTRECCPRQANGKETALADAGFDQVERSILEICRFFFQTFAQPTCQSWLHALQRADHVFDPDHSAQTAFEILAMVQAMRASRKSSFRFNNPYCPGCSQLLTEHERQFIGVLRGLRSGRVSAAQTHAMLLCEGHDTTAFLDRTASLVRQLEQAPVALDYGLSAAQLIERLGQ